MVQERGHCAKYGGGRRGGALGSRRRGMPGGEPKQLCIEQIMNGGHTTRSERGSGVWPDRSYRIADGAALRRRSGRTWIANRWIPDPGLLEYGRVALYL